MRTTLTLDDDLAMMLKQKAEETGQPFRDVVNDAIRHGLDAAGMPEVLPPFPVPRSLGEARIDINQAIHILDEWDDAELVRQMRGEQ